MSNRRDTDWMSEIKDEEKQTTENGNVVVPVVVLRRLAERAGLKRSHAIDGTLQVVQLPDGTPRNLIATVRYEVEFDDGCVFGGCADAHFFNLSDAMRPYVMANCETRAEGRALRKALGLEALAEEEVEETANVDEMIGEITPTQLALIKKKANQKGIKHVDVIKQVCSEERQQEVNSLVELNYYEASEAARFVNQFKVKK